jgi:wyosine [tRNA(Phe)-imidazoG37] synthetase (radical SAM superfamily)
VHDLKTKSIKSTTRLSVADHDRGSAGLKYVYPVVSRRAGGLSVGINLNVNNACNWRCIYCQVPDLARGAPPPVDLQQLRTELDALLGDVLQGDFMTTRVPPEARRLNDIAISGNGEPTSAAEFGKVVDLIAEVRAARRVPEAVKTVLITNGSLMSRAYVQRALARLAQINGEVWFKLDSATPAGMRRINGSRIAPARVRENLRIAATLCPTWLQTCLFALDGREPDEPEQEAYLEFVRGSLGAGVPLRGVLIYSLARPSYQPEAARLQPLPPAWLEAFADKIRALGLPARVTP